MKYLFTIETISTLLINLRISSNTGPNYLFFSNPIIIYDEKVIVSSDPYLYVLDVNTGSTILKKLVSLSFLYKWYVDPTSGLNL